MRKTLILILIIFNSIALKSQTFNECFSYIKDNKPKEAIDCLEELQKNKAFKAEASVCLAMLRAERRDFAAAFDDFKLFYKNSENPYPYFYALSDCGAFPVSESAHGKDVYAFLKDMLAKTDINATTRLLIADIIARMNIENSDFSYLRKFYSVAGHVTNWSSVGVFENISGSGFNKSASVLAHPGDDAEFVNKFGANVKWFRLRNSGNDTWTNLEDHYGVNNSIVFAQSFLGSEMPRDIVLKIGVAGSLKVWLNDALVAEESEERHTGPDVYGYHVKLNQGMNRLFLQVGSSEIDDAKFTVRVLDEKGELCTDVTSIATFVPYRKDTATTVKRDVFFAEEHFENLLKKDKDNFLYKVMLLRLYQKNEKKYAAYKLMMELKKEAPNCTILSELAIKLGLSDNNSLLVSSERESIKKNDPESYTALVLKSDEAIEKKAWGEAVTLIEQIVRLYGPDEDVQIKYMTALLANDQFPRAKEEIDRAERRFPNSNKLAIFYNYWINNTSKDIKTSTELLVKVNEENYSRRLTELIAENFAKLGSKEGVKKQFNRLLANYPSDKSVYLQYSSFLGEMQENDEALRIVNDGLAVAPYDGALLYTKGLILNAQGKKEMAVQALQQSVLYAPWSLQPRTKLNNISGTEVPVGFVNKKNINKIYEQGVADENYKNEDAVMLVNDRAKIVYPGRGPRLDLTETLILIKSKAAIDQLKEMKIPYNDNNQRLIVSKVEVLKKDGAIVPAQREDGHFVFSTLGVDDAIHLLYTIECSYDGNLAEHFWDEFYFDGPFLGKSASYTLIVPGGTKFKHKLIDSKGISEHRSQLGTYDVYEWKAENLAKINPEIAMPQYPMQELIISSIPDWSSVANWYRNLSSNKILPDYVVTEQVKALMKGSTAKTELEKAKVIYTYIENNLHYISVPFIQSAFTPQMSGRTLRSRLGDCKDLSSLFVAMANSAGLNANLVLVSTMGTDQNKFQLPTRDFNHCIAHLVADGKDHYVELTNNNLPFTAIDHTLAGAVALEITKNNGVEDTLMTIPRESMVANCTIRDSKMLFAGKGINVSRRIVKTGSTAAYILQAYKETGVSRRVDMLQADVAREFKKDVKISNVQFPSFDELIDTATIQYDLAVENFVTDVAGMSIFSIPWTEANYLSQIFTLDKRTYPIDMSYFKSIPLNAEVIMISLPAGKKLVELPKDISISNDVFAYSLVFHVDGEKIRASRKLNFFKEEVSPQEYARIKETVKRVEEADAMQFAFK